jgi:hypothetical protein
VLIITGVVIVSLVVMVVLASRALNPASLSKQPSPLNDPAIAVKLNQAKKDVQAQFTAFERELAVRPLPVAEEGDICGRGQNNYKVQQGFEYSCGYGKTHFYTFGKQTKDLWLHSEFGDYLPPSVMSFFDTNGWREDSTRRSSALYKNNIQAVVDSGMDRQDKEVHLKYLNPPLWGDAEFSVTVSGMYYQVVNGVDYSYGAGNGVPDRDYEDKLKVLVGEEDIVVSVSLAKQYHYVEN